MVCGAPQASTASECTGSSTRDHASSCDLREGLLVFSEVRLVAVRRRQALHLRAWLRPDGAAAAGLE